MQQWERFLGPDGQGCGVLVRHLRRTTLRTLSVVQRPDGLAVIESRVEFDSADPFSWTHLVHRTGEDFIDLTRPAALAPNALPSSALALLVARVAEADADDPHQFDVQVLDEASHQVTPGTVLRVGETVEVRVGDRLVVHDVADGQIVATTWGPDLRSVAVDGEDEVLADQPHDVQQSVARFLQGLERGD